MPKFAVFFSYTPQAWKAMLDEPADRLKPVRHLVEQAGGTLETYYWMFGDYDGFGVADMPDAVSGAALSVAVASSGAFARISSTQVFDVDERVALLEKAKAALATYSPPTG